MIQVSFVTQSDVDHVEFLKGIINNTVSPREFEQNTLQRFMQNEAQRRENLERKALEQEMIEEQQLLSSRSNNPNRSKSQDRVPLHKRTDHVLWSKEHKILVAQQRQSEQRQKEISKHCTFQPNLKLTSRKNQILADVYDSERCLTPEKRLLRWGEEKEVHLRQKMLQVEAEKSTEIKQTGAKKALDKDQQLAHANKLIKMGERKKQEIKALVDERMAGLFKPKINSRPDIGGTQTERQIKRQNGEWYGYVSGKNQGNHDGYVESKSISARKARISEDTPSDVTLIRRHEMSSKYETELKRKKDSTLFGRDLSARSIKESSRSQQRFKAQQVAQYPEEKESSVAKKSKQAKKQPQIDKKRQREVLQKLKSEVEQRQVGGAENSRSKIKVKMNQMNVSAEKSSGKDKRYKNHKKSPSQSQRQEEIDEYKMVNKQIQLMESKLRSYLQSNKKTDQPSSKKLGQKKSQAEFRTGTPSSQTSKKTLRTKNSRSNPKLAQHQIKRSLSRRSNIQDQALDYSSPVRNRQKNQRSSSITKSAPRDLSRKQSKPALTSLGKRNSSQLFRSYIEKNNQRVEGSSKSDSDDEDIFYEIPTKKLSAEKGGSRDNSFSKQPARKRTNIRPKFLQPFSSGKKNPGGSQGMIFSDNIFYIQEGGTDPKLIASAGSKSKSQSKRVQSRKQALPSPKDQRKLTSRSNQKSETKIRATSKKESFRISFRQEILPPTSRGRQAEENLGSPLKYYLKEIDEQRIVHNPQNLLQIDEKGIKKILISQDESVGEIENGLRVKKQPKAPENPNLSSPIFVKPTKSSQNLKTQALAARDVNHDSSQRVSVKIRDESLMNKIKTLYQDARAQQIGQNHAKSKNLQAKLQNYSNQFKINCRLWLLLNLLAELLR